MLILPISIIAFFHSGKGFLSIGFTRFAALTKSKSALCSGCKFSSFRCCFVALYSIKARYFRNVNDGIVVVCSIDCF
jgi:hypothetical protein